ncbi:MAG: ATP synthase subunit I [Fimbriimonadaceae bacterium]|nr:MAG: hypothetical protein UZ18_ATM001002583 [Armatimonadetes bacterium OLB18]WKZ80999.1 MAG: ATP synthase subunit I [Fimbriimonadaceae bacterium]
MNKQRALGIFGTGLVVAISALILDWRFGVGLLLGLLSGAFGAYVLYRTVELVRFSDLPPNRRILATVAAFFVKFPLIGIAGFAAYSLSMEALTAFTIAVAMVYSSLVWRATRSDLYSR